MSTRPSAGCTWFFAAGALGALEGRSEHNASRSCHGVGSSTICEPRLWFSSTPKRRNFKPARFCNDRPSNLSKPFSFTASGPLPRTYLASEPSFYLVGHSEGLH